MTASVQFTSERLVLRSIGESDEELYCALFSNAETMRYIGPPWTRAQAALAFRDVLRTTRRRPPRARFLTLTPKDTPLSIGLCTLQNFDRPRRQAELGMMFVPSGRAQGFATETLIAVIAHAFATLQFDEVWVRIAAGHAAAERTAVRGGLVRHAEAPPHNPAANLQRWSAYRASWGTPDRT